MAIAAGAQQLPSRPLVDALERFDESAFRDVFLGIDHTLSWLGVQCLCPRGTPRASVVDYLREQHADASPAERVLARNARVEFVELRVAGEGRVCATVHSVGRQPIDDDTELVRELAELSADSHVLLGALLRELATAGGETNGISAGDDGVMTIRVVLANDSDRQMIQTLAVLDAVAAGVQATGPQREFLRSGHRSLSRGAPCIATLSMQNQMLMEGMGIEYAALSWDTCAQLMAGLHPGVSEPKLEAIFGGCRSEQLCLARIELGPMEPPGLQVWSELVTPRGGVRSVT